MPVSSRLARKVPSIRPTVGKFWMPEKPSAISRCSNSSAIMNGSVPLTPASTGVCLTTGSTSCAISQTISLALP